MNNEKMPKWANTWVKHKTTGELRAALYDHEMDELLYEDGTHFNSEWVIILSSTERNASIAICLLLIGLFIFIAIFKK